MWSYYPELLETPVPRYTSFPTAAEFNDKVGPTDADAALRRANGDVSLYLHIPFCEKICWYCGCNTGAANKSQRLSNYLDSLHREIAITGVRMDPRVAVKRIAFGGGSPNAISPIDFLRLIDALTLHMPLDNPDWSIELDPRTLTADWGQVLGAIGVRYASLGVQTFDPALQAAIGRVQPDADLARATALLRENGIYDVQVVSNEGFLSDHYNPLTKTVNLSADVYEGRNVAAAAVAAHECGHAEWRCPGRAR